MKKNSFLLFMFALLCFGAINLSCEKDNDTAEVQKAPGASVIVWNGASDIEVAADIQEIPSEKANASGPKITSNSHCADFPGVYFIWDYKQVHSGYLKVDASLFANYWYFVLTSKEGNKYFDFPIELQPDQVMTADGCYVFFIPRACNNKNINMVFVSEFTEREVVPV